MPPKQVQGDQRGDELQLAMVKLAQEVEQNKLLHTQQMTELNSKLDQLLKAQSASPVLQPNEGASSAVEDNRRGARNGDSRIHLPKTEFPQFDGTNPSSWKTKCESYFEIFQVPEYYKSQMATLHFTGEAQEWYDCVKLDCPIFPWPLLVEEVFDRFHSYNCSNPVGDFKRVQQTGKVADYIRQFESAKYRLISETKIRNNTFYVQGFIEGLKEDIRYAVEVLEPASLYQAFNFARKAELNLEGMDRRYKSWNKPLLLQPPKYDAGSQSNKGKEWADKKLITGPTQKLALPPPAAFNNMSREQLRQLGLCFYCGEKYSQSHKCTKRKLLMLEASMGEEEMVSEDTSNQETSGDNNLVIDDYVHADISMCTPQDPTDTHSLRFKGYVQHTPIIALLDSGSTHSFIHPTIISLLQLPTLPSPSMIVKTASGAKLISDSRCEALLFKLQNHTFVGDLRVLAVEGYDIILGMDWIAQVGPVIIDCVQGWVQLVSEGNMVKLQVQKESAELRLCQEDINISQELTKGGQLIVAHLFTTYMADQTPETTPVMSIKSEFQEVVTQYKSVFADPSTLPPKRLVDHQIPLKTDSSPVNLRPYRFSYFQKLEIEKIIEELLKSGYIRPSTSPFASPILLVKKKDQTWRMCVDYRQLNECTVKNKFPIPIIDDLLDELKGAVIFSKIDLKSGYHQIRMSDPDIYKTAFRTHLGHYEFTVMPFGLTNAPATFQSLMNSIFQPYLRKFILVFFDDILIYSSSVHEHVQHLALTLQLLQQNHLFAKLSKCVIGTDKVEYLGHIITKEGVATDPEKVQAMVTWPVPKSVKQLRGFLGLTGYYRKFVHNYGIIAKPLTDLLKKDAFRWTSEAQSAFTDLKTAMSAAPVLGLPDFTQPFILETDACQSGIGAVLMQGRRPLAFFSKGLGIKNQSLSTYEKELLALVTAVTKWRHYLLGGPFIIRTDHISLKHLLEQRINTAMQHRSLSKLLGLQYTIEYKKGANNLVADALSRREAVEGAQSEVCMVSEIISQWVHELHSSYSGDEWIQQLKKQLQEGHHDHHKLSEYQGLLRYKGRLCVGQAGGWRTQLLHELHNSNLGGHSGILATYKRLKSLFYWPSMKQFVIDHIKSCEVCQITKPEHVPSPGLLQPLPIPSEAWHSIGMDFITGLPMSDGKEVLLVIVDRLTKYSHFIPLAHPYSAATVAQAFLDNVYKLHGLPMSIVSDRDPIFTSKFWQEIMGKLGIQLNMSTAYHPQSDGQVERVNQCVETYLRSMVYFQQKKWVRWVPLAEYWYNTNFHSSLSTTPFKALYGYDPPSLPLGSAPKSNVEAVNILLRDRQQMLTELKGNLVRAQERMKKQSDSGRTERAFSKGDWVYLKLQPYRQISVSGGPHCKLNPKFYGPFEVLSKIGTVAYKLNLPPTSSIHPVFHVSQLKARVGQNQTVSPSLPIVGTNNSSPDMPEYIVARRLIKRRNSPVPQILLKWKNQSIDDAQWIDFDVISRRFPGIVLEDKEVVERRGMSASNSDRNIAVGSANQSEQEKTDNRSDGVSETNAAKEGLAN
ncbi:hypothetical protein LUZ61_011444 [Rhynchospora tenuis]|uniref:Reverse transcriptase n=1 Tax=Rhynchospora tenuis TaxID=198213 RepID=A0AAD6F0A9_9POAL|nr:hypothetical protein LUZ61_011444 [Rhynchospora tenuis]